MEISEGGFGDQKRIDPIERFGVILFIQRSTVEVVNKVYPIIDVWSYAAPVLFWSLNHEQYLNCRPNVHEVFIGSKENPPPKKTAEIPPYEVSSLGSTQHPLDMEFY